MRRHKHDWYDCESWDAYRGTTLTYRQCGCNRVHVTMFRDADELTSMVMLWLRCGLMVSMEPGVATSTARSVA